MFLVGFGMSTPHWHLWGFLPFVILHFFFKRFLKWSSWDRNNIILKCIYSVCSKLCVYKTRSLISFTQRLENYISCFISSIRSSSGYHGLIEIRSAASHFFKFFKFFRFESESERTQHVLYIYGCILWRVYWCFSPIYCTSSHDNVFFLKKSQLTMDL